MESGKNEQSAIAVRCRAEPGAAPGARGAARLTASWDLRQRSRFRARLDDGREVAVVLPRGGVLREGDQLLAESGLLIDVHAAAESLTVAATDDPKLFARACYHMGNRHVPLQVAGGRMAFQPDHVLSAMLAALGLELSSVQAPFDPEAGAYGGGHHHGHSQGDGQHDHDHDHNPDHPPHTAADSKPEGGPRIHRMGEAGRAKDAGEARRGRA